jgi:hypothetical protein
MIPLDERFSKIMLVLTTIFWKAQLQHQKTITKKQTAPTEVKQEGI